MKKNIGSVLALYPTPVTLIGAMNKDKPTWTLVAHIGIIGHDRVLVSIAARHFINRFIKENKKLSINLVEKEFLPEADYVGCVSGAKVNKSELFEFEMADGVPIINKSPLTITCTVTDIYNTPNFESFICKIDSTLVEEKHLSTDGKINYDTLKPVLFEFPTYQYLETGAVIGKCRTFKNNYNEE